MPSKEKVLSESQLKAQAKRQEKLARRKVYSDLLVQGTNDSSIVSKRSVERLYGSAIAQAQGTKPPEYFKPFVRKPQRRSPVINRGYWIRVQAISKTIDAVAAESERMVIVNLGCGYDSLPFERIDKDQNVFCIDVDYPELIRNKVQMINNSAEVKSIIGPLSTPSHACALLQTERYVAVGCDLRDMKLFKEILLQYGVYSSNTTSIFVAEVSLAYMLPEFADLVIAETVSAPKSHFIMLEQIMPAGEDHPFARTMLKHFNKIGTPLGCVHKYHNTELQEQRFRDAGFPHVHSTDLWQAWKETNKPLRDLIESAEAFDEWEEFVLFCQHYVILHASTTPIEEGTIPNRRDYSKNKTLKATTTDIFITKKFLAGAAVDDDSFVFVGGSDKQRVKTSEMLTLKDTPSFQLTAHTLPARMAHSVVNVGQGEILLFGGRSAPQKLLDDAWRLLKKGGSYAWKKDTPMPSPRSRMAVAKVSETEVLVFGGLAKGSKESSFLVYDIVSQIWTSVASGIPNRGGAAMCWMGIHGLIVGGIGDDDTMCASAILFEYRNGEIHVIRQVESPDFARYGAKMVYDPKTGALLVGGVSNERVLGRENSILCVSADLSRTEFLAAPSELELPMLVGFEMFVRDNELCIIGGGAVCFSFGSVWNRLTSFQVGETATRGWKLLLESETDRVSLQTSKSADPIKDVPIKIVTDLNPSAWKQIIKDNVPVLMKSVDLGACLTKWRNPEYLKSKVGPQPVVIHESSDKVLNFHKKNFDYNTMPFTELVDKVFNDPKAKCYLRALSNDNPKEKPAVFAHDFPSLAEDFQLPACIQHVLTKQHSSPLRVASPETSIWLHYDVTSNILCQIVGTKKLRLFAPSDVDKLSFPAGASSSTIANPFTEPVHATAHTCTMRPGDVLFIPRLWLHATSPETTSISLNIFWKDLENSAYAAGKDVYGNRDIGAYENGRHAVQRIKAMFDTVPEDVRDFYLKRLSQELLQ